ncbi:MAG: gliding motility-associated C-terminal domain-containing protein, partial [Marinoscillum sp.]
MVKLEYNGNMSIGVLLFAILWLATLPSAASHIRAGEITAKRIDNLTRTYRFTFIGFRDRGSQFPFGEGIFDFGDETSQTGNFNITITQIDSEIEMVQFQLVHTYSSSRSFIVSYEEQLRNADISNMDASGQTTFYVESMIDIDVFAGLNDSPVLTVPPIDFAAVGATFLHQPGAFDSNGDSLAYRFTTPKQSRTSPVNNYKALNDPKFYSDYLHGNEAQTRAPELTLNPLTGELKWDAPGDVLLQGDKAEYNVAFVIEEWRYISKLQQWKMLGYVTRDMQIIVRETDNERPNLQVPDDLCVEAGMVVSELIQGTDPDGDPVKIEAFGGPFEVNSPATYTPDPAVYGGPPQFLDLEWNTECGHVRARPYQVQFKVTDDPLEGPRLVNFETMEITVVGPAPQGLEAAVQPGRAIALNWDKYTCANAETMQIWRRVGDFEIEIDECDIGMPTHAGYRLIDEVPASQRQYLDNNNDGGLAPGAKYCYRLVAAYPSPGGGLSYVSAEACDSISIESPVITNVDIAQTGTDNGEIMVRWTPPYEIDQVLYPPAYRYDVFRGEGGSSTFQRIAATTSDTLITDTGLNTLNRTYRYYVKAYDANGVYIDSSAVAGSVRLGMRPLLKSISVSWTADVPWSNTVQAYPYHYIYRDQVGTDTDQLVLIDSVDVTMNGFNYLDEGSVNGELLDEEIEYCYYVVTQGSYDNALLPEPLINRSQLICGQPNDTIPPCTPPGVIFASTLDCSELLQNTPCGTNVFDQEVTWEVDGSTGCDDDIVAYNIYYSSTGNEDDYEFLDEVFSTAYIHRDLVSLKGCYKITSVDRSGNESEATDPICRDNCPVYRLPNAFTPNNDGKNDVFAPLNNNGLGIVGFNTADCPRFVRAVTFNIFDRSGKQVFQYDSFENPNGIYINWDGRNAQGTEMPAGVYYYSAEVTFDVLNPRDATKVFNGWVQLL